MHCNTARAKRQNNGKFKKKTSLTSYALQPIRKQANRPRNNSFCFHLVCHSVSFFFFFKLQCDGLHWPLYQCACSNILWHEACPFGASFPSDQLMLKFFFFYISCWYRWWWNWMYIISIFSAVLKVALLCLKTSSAEPTGNI